MAFVIARADMELSPNSHTLCLRKNGQSCCNRRIQTAAGEDYGFVFFRRFSLNNRGVGPGLGSARFVGWSWRCRSAGRNPTSGRLFTTAITVAEIAYGIERLPKGHRKQALKTAADELFSDFGDQVLIPCLLSTPG